LNLDKISQDTGVPGLSRDKAYEMKIPVVPIEEQKSIADYLDTETKKIDDIIDETEHSITLLKEHRTALISAAVTGKIDVRHLVKEAA
jgi:restriction endonuclease S subunit